VGRAGGWSCEHPRRAERRKSCSTPTPHRSQQTTVNDTERTPPRTTGSATPSATSSPSTTSTTLSAKAELLAAYNRSWDVYADALRRLDASGLATTFAGNALRAAQDEVATQKAKNQPVQISIDHHPRVLRLTAAEGLVEDNYRNHSVVLDPTTGAPTEPDPNEIVYQRQTLKRISEAWKVVEIIEEQRP
jgi:hypothetical protein